MTAPLYERYRPRELSDVIGQSKAVKRIESVGSPGGHAYWISGGSGTGKSTIAEILAGTVADDFFTVTTVGRKLTPRVIDEIVQYWRLCAWGKGGRAWIVNEAHGLSEPSIELLLDVLEPVPANVVFVFTTTREGQAELFEDHIDAHPLLSRCIELALTTQGLAKPFAARAREIAQREGLDGRPPADYVRLCAKHHNNLRAVL